MFANYVIPPDSPLTGTKRRATAADMHPRQSRHIRPKNDGSTSNYECEISRELQLKGIEDLSNKCSEKISSVDRETRHYLEDLFWTQSNSYVPIVSKDHVSAGSDMYSSLLHLAVLATGYKFANAEELNVRCLKMDDRQSSLHYSLRTHIDTLAPEEGNLASIQALILLSELEYGCGRYHSSHLYLEAASTAVEEMGHDLADDNLALSDEDELLRRSLLRSCIFYRNQRRLFENSTISRFSPRVRDRYITSLRSATHRRRRGIGEGSDYILLVYQAQLDLLNLSQPLYMASNSVSAHCGVSRSFGLRELEADLIQFHSELPEQLRWNSQSWLSEPPPVFAFRQQLHAVNMLLYRKWAQVKNIDGALNTDCDVDEQVTYFRHTALQNALKLESLISQFLERFDPISFPTMIVQQLISACAVILSEIQGLDDNEKRVKLLTHLKSCSTILTTMSKTHKIAEEFMLHLTTCLSMASCGGTAPLNPTSSKVGNIIESQPWMSPRNSNEPDLLLIREDRRALPLAQKFKPSSANVSESTNGHNSTSPPITDFQFVDDPVFAAYAEEMSHITEIYAISDKHNSPKQTGLGNVNLIEKPLTSPAANTHEVPSDESPGTMQQTTFPLVSWSVPSYHDLDETMTWSNIQPDNSWIEFLNPVDTPK